MSVEVRHALIGVYTTKLKIRAYQKRQVKGRNSIDMEQRDASDIMERRAKNVRNRKETTVMSGCAITK